MSAMQKVLNTTELLEDILSHLPPRTLVLSRRVNKRFCETARNTKNIQEALFQRAVKFTFASDQGKPTINYFLFELLATSRCWRIELDSWAREYTGDAARYAEVPSLAPATLQLRARPLRFSAEDLDADLTNMMSQPWSDMLLTQPPCAVSVGVSAKIGAMLNTIEISYRACTVASLLKRIRHLCNSEPGRYGIEHGHGPPGYEHRGWWGRDYLSDGEEDFNTRVNDRRKGMGKWQTARRGGRSAGAARRGT